MITLGYRPETPDFSEAVYCLVGVWYNPKFPNDLEQADLSVHGTCFAIGKHHLVTALHNITDNKLVNMGIAKLVYKAGKIDPDDFKLVTQFRSASQAREDWTILVLSDLSHEMTYLPIILDKMNLPASGTHLVIHDFPIGAFVNPEGGTLTCEKLATSIFGYQNIGSTAKLQKRKAIKLAKPTIHDLKREQVVIKHGRSVGSCGGPYCLRDGTVLAFHVASQDDFDGSYSDSRSYTSYGVGHILCAFKEFVETYTSSVARNDQRMQHEVHK